MEIESKQVANTPGENIRHFETQNVEGYCVCAIFGDKQQRDEYIQNYSSFMNTKNWWDQVGFAQFTKEGNNKIKAFSAYHTENSMIQIFVNGLKL